MTINKIIDELYEITDTIANMKHLWSSRKDEENVQAAIDYLDCAQGQLFSAIRNIKTATAYLQKALDDEERERQ